MSELIFGIKAAIKSGTLVLVLCGAKFDRMDSSRMTPMQAVQLVSAKF